MNQLAETLYKTKWENIKKETIHSAKLVLLDTLAAMIAGNQQEAPKKLIESLCYDKGNFLIFGTGEKTTCYNAALVNGVATVATEMDEGNQWSKGHPAAHVVPTMLTYVQKFNHYSGKEFLLNLIKAYEACSRFGRATTLLEKAHAHGTWGVMGAAASALLLENVSQEDFVKGINLSATFALPTMWEAALNGDLIRNVYAGHAIEMGIKTVSFLKSSHTAPRENIEYIFSSVIGTRFNLSELRKEESAPWDIELNYFKPYAFCRYSHAPLDAFKKLMEAHRFDVEQIARINVRTYSRAATLSRQDYRNALAAKFSIPYALAVWANEKTADHSAFSDDFLTNKEIKKFANKVYVIESSELNEQYPKIMPAVVEIIDKEGKAHQERIDIASGGPGKKLTENEIKEKFYKLTDNVYSKKQQDEIFNCIIDLDNKSNMCDLIHLSSVRGGF